jgi:hypothetical protein
MWSLAGSVEAATVSGQRGRAQSEEGEQMEAEGSREIFPWKKRGQTAQ